jgi:hypothetical protein
MTRPAPSGQVIDQLLDGIAALDAKNQAAREEETQEAEAEEETPAAPPSANGGNGRHRRAGKGGKRKAEPSGNGAIGA